MSIGSKIKELCDERGITRASLARQVHVSQDTMYGYTYEKCIPNAEVLHDIAKYFGVDMEYFWE